ncbi:hypothetical protein [Caballeronia sordidicola]|uniref:hypothetical protein n=1 Tax=Caballeronia sordidicola TaxID=196367 RepID=UPI000B291126|nr:hypothetical protein [Caballeronia sordidicola]
MLIFLDNNVWDFLFERRLDLSIELPSSEYKLAITREGEFEIAPIPDHKAELKAFIAKTIARCAVGTDTYFGFGGRSLPANERRFAGFGFGRFAQTEESKFIGEEVRRWKELKVGAHQRKSKLFKHEADISLGARSFHYVVVSLDDKPGPLTRARDAGGRVVFLTDFDASGLSLREFIERESKV